MSLLEQVVQNPQSEPEFTSDAESWAVYVGPVLPESLVRYAQENMSLE